MTDPGESRRAVLVTGAASGIGRAMVDQFLDGGDRVIGVDRDAGGLEALARELPEVTCIEADVSDEGDVDRAFEEAGAVEVLCSNAGILDEMDPVADASLESFEAMLTSNLTSMFLVAKRALPGMVDRSRGWIVNTASAAGLRGGRGGPAYTASKFGVVGLTQSIASSYGPKGVRCNAVCPGPTATGIGNGLEISPAIQEVIGRSAAMPSPASPEGVAAVACFLAGEGASLINGAAIPVDQGWVAY